MSKSWSPGPDETCDICDTGSSLPCRCPDHERPRRGPRIRTRPLVCRQCGHECSSCHCYAASEDLSVRAYDRKRIWSLVLRLEGMWQLMSDASITEYANTIDTIARKHCRSTRMRMPDRTPRTRAEAINDLVEAFALLRKGRATWFDLHFAAHTVALYHDPTDAAIMAEMFFPEG